MRFLLSSVVLFGLASIVIGQGTCPATLAHNVPCYELTPNSSYCYCFSFVQATWAEAFGACRNNSELEARLLSIETSAEQQLLETFLQDAPGLSLIDYFWTSASDSQVEGAWFWTSTGDLLTSTYTNWIEGFYDHDADDCMILSQAESYYWYDRPCDTKRSYICEGTVASWE